MRERYQGLSGGCLGDLGGAQLEEVEVDAKDTGRECLNKESLEWVLMGD